MRDIQLLASLVIATTVGCSDEPSTALRVANVQTLDQAGTLGGVFSLVDSSGTPIVVYKTVSDPADTVPGVHNGSTDAGESVELSVETRSKGGAWHPATGVVLGTEHPTVDVVVVADNSGSEESDLELMRTAIAHFAHVILASAHADRIGLVRVSTEAATLSPLVASEDELATAISSMFVHKGWTALWDGVRQANEMLAAGSVTHTGDQACLVPSAPTIVMFTDGADNNSADEHATSYPGDGVDTRLADLTTMSVNGARTVVYAVGTGDRVDADGLTQLAEATGGVFENIVNYGHLIGVLESHATQLEAQQPVCFTPAAACDDEAHVVVTIGHGAKTETVERTITLTGCAP